MRCGNDCSRSRVNINELSAHAHRGADDRASLCCRPLGGMSGGCCSGAEMYRYSVADRDEAARLPHMIVFESAGQCPIRPVAASPAKPWPAIGVTDTVAELIRRGHLRRAGVIPRLEVATAGPVHAAAPGHGFSL